MRTTPPTWPARPPGADPGRERSATGSVLLVTADEALQAEVLRLAAAAGASVDAARDADEALRTWTTAPLVLVGTDRAAALARRQPPRREGVHVVTVGPGVDGVFRDALDLGARDVVELPAAATWLVELLSDASEGSGTAPAAMVAVVGGSGGAGASTFAAALAVTASAGAPGRRTVLLDLDPWGAGLDRIVGLDRAAGVRWEALLDGAGRLGSRSLRESLPARDGLAVLTWASLPREAPGALPPAALLVEVLSAAQRGGDVVVVDLPRTNDPGVTEVLARSDAVVLLGSGSLGGAVAAARVTSWLRSHRDDPGLVVRAGSSLSPEAMAEALGLPLLASYPTRPRVVEEVDLGLGPVRTRRSPLARAASRVMVEVAGVRGSR